jgi:hypothetical protein
MPCPTTLRNCPNGALRQGRVDRFYDIDENEVDEGDPRAFAGHSWKYSHYECVAQCNDNNCVYGVDPDVYPNHAEECDRREKLLRKALNKKYLVQAMKGSQDD